MFAPTSPIFLSVYLFPTFRPHGPYCLPHSSPIFLSFTHFSPTWSIVCPISAPLSAVVLRARIWLRAAFVPKLRLGRVAICKLEPALNVILAKSHKGVPAKPLPMCNMCFIKIYHKNNFITLYTGRFFNGYPPENVSRLATPEICLNWHPPKFSKCWNQIHFARH